MTINESHYEIDGNGCWLWSGHVSDNGYARYYDRSKGRTTLAHRYSYVQHVGPIAAGNQIDHMCQVTRCVNPEHLQQLTPKQHCLETLRRLGKIDQAQTAIDMLKGGSGYVEISRVLGYKHRSGAIAAVQRALRVGLVSSEEVPRRKLLTETERSEITALAAKGVGLEVIASQYGITSSHASRVSRGFRSGHSQTPEVFAAGQETTP